MFDYWNKYRQSKSDLKLISNCIINIITIIISSINIVLATVTIASPIACSGGNFHIFILLCFDTFTRFHKIGGRVSILNRAQQ